MCDVTSYVNVTPTMSNFSASIPCFSIFFAILMVYVA
jgi:hypothetical protein